MFKTKSFLNKKVASAAVLLLILAVSCFSVLPIASAHDPAWDVPLFSYITATPNPIGAGQTAFVVFWFDKPPPTAAGSGGDRWTDIMIEVTKPDGSKETLGPYTSDSVGGAYATYTPSQTGIYTLTLTFPGQVASLYHPDSGVEGTPSAFVGDFFSATTASMSLVVQSEEIENPPTYPLPTEFWSRPIEGQNTEWSTIASNWLSGPFGYPYNKFQPDGLAPNSAHVMWTKEVHFGGVVGGSNVGGDGMTYYGGLQYECKFGNFIILQGRVYYNIPLSNNPFGAGYACVDLTTGEQLWWLNTTFGSEPMNTAFGQLFDYESMNQHGVIPNGYIWKVEGTTWMAYDAFTGSWLFNLTNVPAGKDAVGANGERLRYVLNAQQGWLALWNNTAAPGAYGGTGTGSAAYQWRPIGKNIDASTAYTWNITIPGLKAGSAIIDVAPNDILLCRASAFAGLTGFGTPDPYTLFAVSLKPQSLGQILWTKNYSAPPNNITRVVGKMDPTTRVFTMYDKETVQWSGYSLDNGEKLWGPTQSEHPFNYYATSAGVMSSGTSQVAYGKLYSTGFSGALYCYDMRSGDLLWNYSTPSGFATPYGGYSSLIGAIADGKVYTYFIDHSPNAPPYKGVQVRCINAESGAEVWTIMSWGGDRSLAIADGYLIYYNLYDGQIYCIGKGPSQTTVVASPKVTQLQNSVLIEGTVTDQSAGAKDLVSSGRFSAVAAMSDVSQTSWMEYLYMQKPKPVDAVGVEVQITVYDPDGNPHNLGTTTTDLNGKYVISWTPPKQGTYCVVATYWGSQDTTYFQVDPTTAQQPTTTTTPTTPTTETPTQTPAQTTPLLTPTSFAEPSSDFPTETLLIIGAAIVIIAAVATIAVLLRKRQ